MDRLRVLIAHISILDDTLLEIDKIDTCYHDELVLKRDAYLIEYNKLINK